MIVNLLLVGGHIGRPGAGTVCVRGHSNVQGDRTMGVWERPPKAFLDVLGKEFNFEPPRKSGYDTVETLHAMFDGDVKVFFGDQRQFPFEHAGHGLHRARYATLQPHRSRFDQTKSLSSDYRGEGTDSSLPGANGGRNTEDRQAVPDHRGFHGHHQPRPRASFRPLRRNC